MAPSPTRRRTVADCPTGTSRRVLSSAMFFLSVLSAIPVDWVGTTTQAPRGVRHCDRATTRTPLDAHLCGRATGVPSYETMIFAATDLSSATLAPLISTMKFPAWARKRRTPSFPRRTRGSRDDGAHRPFPARGQLERYRRDAGTSAAIGWHDAPALLARQTALSITIALLMMTPINVSCMQHCIIAKS